MDKKSNYNRLILVTIILTLMIIGGFIFVFTYFHDKIEETRISQYNNQETLIAIQTASSLKDFMEHMKLELISMSSTSSTEFVADKELFSSYHRSMIESVKEIVKLDNEGKIVQRTGDAIIDGLDIKKEEFFYNPLSTGNTFISMLNKNNNKSYLIISIPTETKSYNSETNYNGVILAILDVSIIDELYLSQIKIGIRGYVWAIQRDGTLLTEPKDLWNPLSKGENYFDWVKSNYPQNSNNINKLATENTGSIIDFWDSHGKTITSFSHVDLGQEDWIIAVTTPYAELEQGIYDLQQKMLYFLLAMLSLLSMSFLFLLFLLRSKEKTELKLEKAELTLEKLGIKAIPEKTDEGIDIDLKENKIYLLKEKYEKKCFDIFKGLLNKGYLGLAITRENPDEIKTNYKLNKTPFIWLRKPLSKKDVTSVIDVKNLYSLIEEFISKNKKTVIIIERIDYVITQNNYDETLKFIQKLKDSLINDSIIILSLNPNTISSTQLSQIEEECQDISNLIEGDRPNLAKDVYDILNFIYVQNMEKRKVFFKTISKEFNITKPTTKKKLNEIEKLDFIKIEESGRVKWPIVTEKGMNFLKNK